MSTYIFLKLKILFTKFYHKKKNCFFSAIFDKQLLQFGITRHWYKNGAKLDIDSENVEFLSIPYLRDLDHEGNYICEIITQIGKKRALKKYDQFAL